MQDVAVGGVPMLQFLDTAAIRWEAAVNKMYNVRDSIHSDHAAVADDVRTDIATFRRDTAAMKDNFMFDGPFNPVAFTQGMHALFNTNTALHR